MQTEGRISRSQPDPDLFDFSKKLVNLKGIEKEYKKVLDNLKQEIQEVENSMIDMMLEEEIQNFNKDGQTFYLAQQVNASIPVENRVEVIDWFKDHPYFNGLVKENIDSRTLSAWVRERREEETMPEEIVDKLSIFEKTVIRVRKA